MADITYTQFPIEADIVDISQMETDISNAQTDILSLGQNKADKTTTINGLSLAQNRTLYVQDIPSKNILIVPFVNGSISDSGADTTTPNRLRSALIAVEPSTTYTISMDSSAIKYQEFDTYNSSGTWTGYVSLNATSATFTTNASTYFIKVIVTRNNGTAISPSDLNSCDVQLEKGSTATAYVPYAKTNVELTNDIGASVSYTPTSLVTVNRLMTYRVGKIVSVCGNLTAASAISSNDNLITFGASLALLTDCVGMNTSDGSNINMYVTKGGVLRPAKAIASGVVFTFNFTFVTE